VRPIAARRAIAELERMIRRLLVVTAPLLVLALVLRFGLAASGAGGRAGAFAQVLHFLLLGAAAGLLLLRAWAVRAERAGWLLLGVAVLSWTAGELVWTAAFAQRDPLPFPTVSDALWLGFFPASYAGLLVLLRSRIASPRTGLWIDGIVGGLVVASIGSVALLDPIVAGTGGPMTTVAVNLAYPLGDAVLVALVVTTVALTGWRPDSSWVLILGGLTTIAAADVLFLWQTATATYEHGAALDVMWPAGMLALGAAAWQPRRKAPGARLEGRAALAAPLVLAVAALAVLGYASFASMNGAAVVLAMAALAGVLVRAALTFGENLRLLTQTRRDALTDALTGLGNRRRLVADLQAELPADSARPRLLVLLDLDGFKDYNDAYGHAAGDALLARLAGNFEAAVRRRRGSAYRIGGDEFCALVDWEPTAQGDRVAALAAALAERGGAFSIRASYGAVALGPEADDADAALQLADTRMYASKASANRRLAHQARAVLLEALGAREPGLRDHVDGVAELCRAVGVRMGMEAEQLDELVRAAELHDIGKLAIPDTILTKPGPLDAEEWDFMRRHTLIGEAILAAAPALQPVARLVRSTHERWDGGGYPDRLAGDAIPLGARIVFVCDTFHAMTSDRCYRAALSASEALAELTRCAGTQFDPAVVAVFRDVVSELDAPPASVVLA
jgi:diguanylate cyclase (GGDEF)-like protein